ncbi:MAG: cupin domain-containing protein [Gammaproteobacteria bacterium]
MKSIFLMFVLLLPGSLHAGESDHALDGDVITVKSPEEILSKQKLKQFVGISSDTAGATGLSMNLVIIPPGGAAEAHYHDGFESAVYLVQGRVETRFGKDLEKSVINESGDFIFIPPNVPHQPRNLSETEPAIAIVSRNDANEQENVVHYQPE